MAGKNNAQPAKQAEPAKDAAMVETAGGAVEQTVTPPTADGGIAPGGQGEEYAQRVRAAAALEDAGARIRDGGGERPATAEDILAVAVNGREAVVVTRDGRKYFVKAGIRNEDK